MAKSGKKGDKGGPKVRSKMGKEDVESLLVTLALSSAVRAHAARMLTPDMFRPDEFAQSLYATVVIELAEKYSDVDVIPFLDLKSAVRERFDSLGAGVSDAQWNDILATPAGPDDRENEGLLHYIYTEATLTQFTVPSALDRLKRFLIERGADAPLKRALLHSGDAVVSGSNLADMFVQTNDFVARVNGITGTVGATFADIAARAETAVPPIPAKVPFISRFLRGGLVAPEIYGITAGTGYGKSTLVHQLAIGVAQSLQQLADKDDSPLRASLVFSYEDNDRRMYVRGMACAALIKKTAIDAIVDVEADLLKVASDYDAALAKAENIPPDTYPPEYTRYMKALKALSRNYTVFDLTKPGSGDGGVDEVCGLIDQYVDRTGMAPGLVVVDSIDLLAENYLIDQVGGLDIAKALPAFIPRMVHALRKRVGTAHGCPVVVTNQLAGANLKKESGAKLDHSDAGGSKSWAKGLDVHWVLGKPTDDEKVALFACTKDRPNGNNGQSAMIKLDGIFGRWLDVSADYVLYNGKITPRNVAATVHIPTKATMPATAADFVDDVDAEVTDLSDKGAF